MRKRVIVLFSLVVFLVLGIVSASVNYNSKNLVKSYDGGEKIKGTINVSINNERAKSVFTSNFPGNISLLNFLESNGLERGVDFRCSNPNCNDFYSPSNVVNSFGLQAEKILGLKLEGDNVVVEDIKFNIVGSSLGSCGNAPLLMDFMADDSIELISNAHRNETCVGKNYGCFNNGLDSGKYTSVDISDSRICENVSVLSGPGYKVGARIMNKSGGSPNNLRMEIIDFDGFELGNCLLPEHSSNDEEVECIINYNSPVQANFFVCVSNSYYNSEENFQYTIKSERESPKCGTSGSDFEIFASPLKYGGVNMSIKGILFDSLNLDPIRYGVNDYLLENYKNSEDGGVSCNPFCVVPIKFSGISQTLNFSEIDVAYKFGGLTTHSKKIYELKKDESLISSNGSLVLDLEKAGFVIPLGSSKNEFKLNLNGELEFKEDIKISKSFSFDLAPRFVLIGRDTNFEVISGDSITSSSWDFGEGVVKKSSGKIASHRYLTKGVFELKVSLERADGVGSSGIFKIEVGNPKDAANLTIIDYNERIVNVKKALSSFDSWISEEIKKIYNFSSLESSLKSLEIEYNNSNSEDNYLNVMNKLLKLNIPISIKNTESGSVPFAIGFNNIDVGYIEKISKEKTKDSKKLKEEVIKWMIDQYGSNVEFETISSFSDGGEDALLSRFKFAIDSKKEFEGNKYFFIDYPMKSIRFKRNYDQEAIDSGAYIILDDETENIEFFIREKISVEELGAFISPEIFAFGIVEEILPEEKPKFNTGKFVVWIIILFFVTLGGYIFLQEWYKRNYEGHLFRNKNDLYNLINFIYNSKVARLDYGDIRNKLKGMSWKGEQINYAFRKLEGKRTGLWEIPVFKIFENMKVKKELQRRQRRPVDARFIKQQGLY